MRDPYSVLGVDQNASDEEIKNAYRELARKYHPDNYQNNPLADLAEEKMKEINEAYDAITKMRVPVVAGYQQVLRELSASRASYGGSANPTFAQIRNLINAGDLQTGGTAFYWRCPRKTGSGISCSGSIAYRKGWLDEAMQQLFTWRSRWSPTIWNTARLCLSCNVAM